jgi:MFS family permease
MDREKDFMRARLAVLIAFFINGAVVATWASRIPNVQVRLGLSDAELGLVLLGLPVGLLTALMLVSRWIAKFSSQKVLLAMAILSSATLPILAIAPGPIWLFVVLFLNGCGVSAMDVAMNEQAVLVERQAGKPMMSSFHAGFSIGGFAGALLSAGLIAIPFFTPFRHFLASSILYILLAFAIYRSLIVSEKRNVEQGPVFQIPARALWILGAIALASALGEGTSTDWSAVYLTQVLHSNPSIAALGYAAFSLTMTAGRVIGDWMTEKLKPSGVIRLGGFLSALGFFLVLAAPSPAFGIIGFALAGFGLSNTIPVLFSVAGNHPDFSPGTAIAGVATIGYIGFLIGPPLIGTIAEISSLRVAFGLVALATATMFFSSRSLYNEKE